MAIAKDLVSKFNNLSLSDVTTDKIGKSSFRYHVDDDTFSKIIAINMANGAHQVNLNLKHSFPIDSLINELGAYENYYSFRDDITELKFNQKINGKEVSLFIDGKANSISDGKVEIVTPKGEAITYAPYLVDCLTILS